MKYPDDFNTPAFPAGKFVAVSRFMATVIMVVFFLIVCVCGIILWVKKTQDISPFLVYIDPYGERWVVVAHDNHRTEIPVSFLLQESLVNKFARNWFAIYDNFLLNQANWSADCSRTGTECTEHSGDIVETCAIYCDSSDEVFTSFKNVVLPVYSELEENGATWTVQNVRVRPMNPMDSIADNNNGMWRLNVLVRTNSGDITFIGYARTSYNETSYPKSMGYYISEFNMYRMN